MAGQKHLGQIVPAANRCRRKPCCEPYGSPHKRRRWQRVPWRDLSKQRYRQDQAAIVDDPERSCGKAEDRESRQRLEIRNRIAGDSKDGELPGGKSSDNVCDCCRDEHGSEYGLPEVFLHLFENEDHARKRSIKGGRQPGSGPGSDEDEPLSSASLQPAGNGRARCSAELNRGTFAPQCKPPTDRERAAKKLDEHYSCPIKLAITMQNGFQVRNSAAGRFRSIAPDKKDCQAGPCCTEKHRTGPAGGRLMVRPGDQRVTEIVAAGKHPAKGDR